MLLAQLATAVIITAASNRDFPVRISDPKVRIALVCASFRSPTLRRLVAELRERRAIVYLRWSPVLPPLVRGAVMPRVTATGDIRYLWIALKPDKITNSLTGLIAHEIQHTIEILDAGVTDAAAIGAMYERLEGNRDNRTHDTPAARAIGLQVERELSNSRAGAEKAP